MWRVVVLVGKIKKGNAKARITDIVAQDRDSNFAKIKRWLLGIMLRSQR